VNDTITEQAPTRNVRDFLSSPLPEGTTVLEASAGTGKTYSIAHIALRLIAEYDFDISELLIVTFTEAAAAELRERVRARCREGLAVLQREQGASGGDPTLDSWAELARSSGEANTYARRLDRALTRFDAATISTIHSFCQRVITQSAFESGADFGLELASDPKALITELVSDYLGEKLASVAPADYRRVLAHDFPVRTENLQSLADTRQRNPRASVIPGLQRDPNTKTPKERIAAFRVQLPALVSDFREALGEHRKSFLSATLDQIDAALRSLDEWESGPLRWKTLSKLFPDEVFAGRKARAREDDCRRLSQHALCVALVELHAADRPSAMAWTSALHHGLLERLEGDFAERKSQRGVMTFDDLIAFVAKGLDRGDALALTLRQRFRVALIDEFQDTDELQWQIFRKVFQEGGHRLFLIGDPKQAIYSFRGADLDVYFSARESGHQRAALARNYRTDSGLVSAVSALFHCTEHPFYHRDLHFPEVQAEHQEQRIRLADGSSLDPLRFYVLGKIRDDGKRIGREEEWVARDVLGFLQAGAEIEEGGEWRPVTPRDCAVLVRTNRQAATIQRHLRELGVPSVLRSDSSVFVTPEANDLALWLRAIARPTDGYALRALLSTRLAGISATEVAATLDNETEHERWVARVAHWAEQFEEHGVMRALRRAASDLEFESRWASEREGERRLANVWHLAELLHAEAISKKVGPAGLVRWMQAEATSSGTPDESRQVRLETDADAVEIATIHKAKGLEYPVVWCSSLWDWTWFPRWPLLGSSEGKRVIGLVDSEESRENARQQEFQEQIRLAYVALTRAKHLCCVPWKPPYHQGKRVSPLHWLIFGKTIPGQSLDDVGRDIAAAANEPARLDAYCAMLKRRFSNDNIAVLGDGFQATSHRYERAKPELTLSASEYSRSERLDSLWRWTSFSGIKQSEKETDGDDDLARAGGSDEAVLEDAESEFRSANASKAADAVSPSSTTDGATPAHFAGFRGGTQLGNLLHEVLEVADFASPSSLHDEVSSRMHRYGLGEERSTADNPIPSADDVAGALLENLDTPIVLGKESFRLSEVPAADRIAEMAFTLPLGRAADSTTHISPRRLADVFRRHGRAAVPASYGDHVEKIGFTALRGLLRGSLDLVFRRGDRYYVADYKSNWLGDTLADYAVEHLIDEMATDHYHLQAQLYGVALHRFLASRLGDYDPARHFGGCVYFFLRGMTPETGSQFGVYFDATPTAALLDLERTLFRTEAAAT